MREVADQLLVRLGLFQQALLAVLAHLLLQRPKLHQHLAARVGRGHVHMHGHRVLVQAPEAGFIAQGSKVVAAGAGQRRLQEGGIGKELREVSAFQRAAGHAQLLLQGRIGIEHRAIGAQNGHQERQQIQGLQVLRPVRYMISHRRWA